MIDAKVIYSPIVNCAMQQNHIPFIQKIEISNLSDTDIGNPDIRLESDPDFIKDRQAHISALSVGEEYYVEKIETVFSTDVLSSLTERIEGSFDIIVSSGEGELLHKTYPVVLLAFYQWQGENNCRELISAFVTPNHLAIAPILKRASEIIDGWTGCTGHKGYQSDSHERVRFQMGAIYEALSVQGIAYCGAPASFEEAGQRVRLADMFISEKIATNLNFAPQEIGVAALSVHEEQEALAMDELLREIVKRFGYVRHSNWVNASVSAGISHLINSEKVKNNEDYKLYKV